MGATLVFLLLSVALRLALATVFLAGFASGLAACFLTAAGFLEGSLGADLASAGDDATTENNQLQ